VRLVLLGVVTGALAALGLLAAAIMLAPPGSPAQTSRPLSTIAVPSTQSRTTPTDGPSVATASASTAPSVGTNLGQVAPDFALRSLHGDTVHLSDFRGHHVWINFWAPWCPPCREEIPRLEGVYLTHKADGLVVLGVAVRDSEANIRAFVREVGVMYPIVLDEPGDVAGRYRALALPVQYWVDRDGVVRGWEFGELPPDQRDPSLAKILAAPSPSPTR